MYVNLPNSSNCKQFLDYLLFKTKYILLIYNKNETFKNTYQHHLCFPEEHSKLSGFLLYDLPLQLFSLLCHDYWSAGMMPIYRKENIH